MPLFFYFFLTLLLELPFVVWAYRKEWKWTLLVGFLLNLFTWPLLIYLYHHTTIHVNWLEIGVALTEGLGYGLFMKGSRIKAFVLAFAVNGFSYGFGLLLNQYI
jgi:hypothetical protein